MAVDWTGYPVVFLQGNIYQKCLYCAKMVVHLAFMCHNQYRYLYIKSDIFSEHNTDSRRKYNERQNFEKGCCRFA